MVNARAVGFAWVVLGLAAASVDAAASCRLARVAEWPVRLIANHLVVDGAVNGQRVGVMLDTGGITMILRSATDRLGLTRRTARGYRLFGVGGESYVESTIVDEFTLGAVVRKNWEVMVAGERDPGKGIDVILGEDVFDKVDVEFDLPHKRIRLFQDQGCEGVALAYWAPQGAGQADVESDRRILVAVKVNGQPVQAMLDSGSSLSVLDKPVAARLGIGPDSPGFVFAAKGGGLGVSSVDYWVGPLQSFTIGDEAISDTVIRVADLWKDATYESHLASRLPEKIEDTPGMLLGADFLRAHRVLVAHSQRKMYFTYEGGPVFQPRTREGSSPKGTPAASSKDPALPKANSN